jgi:hypothetical protein
MFDAAMEILCDDSSKRKAMDVRILDFDVTFALFLGINKILLIFLGALSFCRLFHKTYL